MLPVLAAVALGGLGIKWISDINKEIQSKELAEQLQKKIESSEAIVSNFEAEWVKRFKSLVVIDANIWMTKEYDDFFKDLEWVMKKYSTKTYLSSTQFDEIINLKDLPYDNPKSRLARCALSRIEHFQKLGLVKIIPITIQSNKNAYADPDIIHYLLKSSEKYSIMTLITNDVELRIRTNQIINDRTKSDFLSIGGKELSQIISDYKSSVEYLDKNV